MITVASCSHRAQISPTETVCRLLSNQSRLVGEQSHFAGFKLKLDSGGCVKYLKAEHCKVTLLIFHFLMKVEQQPVVV